MPNSESDTEPRITALLGTFQRPIESPFIKSINPRTVSDVSLPTQSIAIEETKAKKKPATANGLGPNLSVNRPAACAAIAIPMEVRSRIAPANASFSRSRLINRTGTKNRIAVAPPNPNNRVITARLKFRFLNILNSSIGALTRSSNNTNAKTISAKPIPSSRNSRDTQDRPTGLLITNTSNTIAPAERKAPTLSNGVLASSDMSRSDRKKTSPATKATAMGISRIINIHSQGRNCNIKPAKIGPDAPPSPTAVVWLPIAFPRSLSGKADTTIPVPTDCPIALPTDVTTRATSRIEKDGANAVMRAPSPNRNKPPKCSFLRPAMSPKRPIGIIKALITTD